LSGKGQGDALCDGRIGVRSKRITLGPGHCKTGGEKGKGDALAKTERLRSQEKKA